MKRLYTILASAIGFCIGLMIIRTKKQNDTKKRLDKNVNTIHDVHNKVKYTTEKKKAAKFKIKKAEADIANISKSKQSTASARKTAKSFKTKYSKK